MCTVWGQGTMITICRQVRCEEWHQRGRNEMPLLRQFGGGQSAGLVTISGIFHAMVNLLSHRLDWNSSAYIFHHVQNTNLLHSVSSVPTVRGALRYSKTDWAHRTPSQDDIFFSSRAYITKGFLFLFPFLFLAPRLVFKGSTVTGCSGSVFLLCKLLCAWFQWPLRDMLNICSFLSQNTFQ